VGILASRPLIEGAVRRRVERHRRVRLASGSAVAGLLVGSGRVEGVRLAAGGAAAALRADLVVDASGRSSRCREWLAEAGFQPPEEERVEVGIGYTTRRYRRRPLRGGKLAVLSQAAPPAWRSAAALAQEGDTWIVSLGGYLGDRAPAEERGFLEYARSVASPEIARIVETAEPVSGFASFGHRASVRRRCERLASFPEGLLLFGDALCSFNPVYGQGISVAAVEAGALARCLTLGTDGLAPRFFAAAARIVDAPWQLAAGGDLRHPRVPGPRTARSLTVNWYLAALHAAAHRDPALTRAFLAVTNLLEPPGSLFLPPVALRVARGLLARAAAAGLASPAGRGAFARAPTEGASGVAAASWIPISRSPRRARPRELPPGPRP
jgi:2-polyprenyl-6-methoxyphenol hydroxylase-like FAD-dependent oxidoreductase